MSHTRDQKRFTISEVAADWHELMIPQRTMRPSIAASANNWTRGLQPADIPPPQSATLGLHPVARKLLFISLPAEGRRLSWPEHAVGYKITKLQNFTSKCSICGQLWTYKLNSETQSYNLLPIHERFSLLSMTFHLNFNSPWLSTIRT